jgi:hypothetical protein
LCEVSRMRADTFTGCGRIMTYAPPQEGVSPCPPAYFPRAEFFKIWVRRRHTVLVLAQFLYFK